MDRHRARFRPGAKDTVEKIKREIGFGTAEIKDRYKTSKPSYPVPVRNFPASTLYRNELWQVASPDSLTIIRTSLSQPYGSRYTVAGYGQTGNKIVVIQNPAGPIERTSRGYKTQEASARLGQFMADMNTAAGIRRRRGQ